MADDENKTLSEEAVQKVFAEVAGMSLEEALAKLHEGLARDLLIKVRTGLAGAATLNVARQFLKDNGIDGTTDGDNNPLADLVKELPFSPAESDLPN